MDAARSRNTYVRLNKIFGVECWHEKTRPTACDPNRSELLRNRFVRDPMLSLALWDYHQTIDFGASFPLHIRARLLCQFTWKYGFGRVDCSRELLRNNENICMCLYGIFIVRWKTLNLWRWVYLAVFKSKFKFVKLEIFIYFIHIWISA